MQDNLSEIIHYDDPAFPIRAYQGELREYVGRQVPTHWHSEVELICILEGSAVYHVNAGRYPLRTGEGLLVNSNRVHYGYSPDQSNFRYAILQFRPDFVENGPLRQKYLNRLIGDSSLDAAWIPTENTQLLSCLQRLIALNLERPEGYELEVAARFYQLLGLLVQMNRDSRQSLVSSRIPALQNMLSYIQNHYAEPIRLADIAAAGAMCRSKCCELFRKVLQQSPLEFTQSFRIQRSIRLLQETDLSVSEIAERCGFSSASYYIECFHRTVGQPPKKYRTLLQRERGEEPECADGIGAFRQ